MPDTDPSTSPENRESSSSRPADPWEWRLARVLRAAIVATTVAHVLRWPWFDKALHCGNFVDPQPLAGRRLRTPGAREGSPRPAVVR